MTEREPDARRYLTRSVKNLWNSEESINRKLDEGITKSKIEKLIDNSVLKKKETKEINRKRPYEQSNFDFTVWDRNIQSIDEMSITKVFEDVTPFSKEDEKFKQENKALLWHVRFGHASVAYLKAL